MRFAWLALLALSACGEDAPDASARGAARASAAPSPSSDLVAREIARLDALVAAAQTPPAAPPSDIEEHVLGLLSTIGSVRDQLGGIAAEELAGLGSAAVPVLARALGERERDLAERAAAARALGAIATPDALEALLVVLESSRASLEREPDVYAACAAAIGAPAEDWIAPRLTLCLKYEVDYPTVVRIADSLGRLGLYSGLDALFVITRDAGEAGVRAEAEALLERWRAELGCADWVELAELWNGGRLERLPPPPGGLRYEREVWRTVGRLGEWQLRGVDDARFTLLQLRENAAAILAQALGDADVYVRLHSAQCRARMGPRGRCAEAALVGVLEDPQVGATAAEALGHLGGEVAVGALTARLGPEHALDLRVACARALGRLAPEDLAETL
ncbi:MAG TPA: HEAT repeat domain-containing protein, partial [Planctomycetota bacterium]|nr:HEAT repeat domain-containing protein [Planctomycetota bacterium]